MTKQFIRTIAMVVCAVAIFGGSQSRLIAAEETVEPSTPSKSAVLQNEAKSRPYPFRGRLDSIDMEKRTITLQGKTTKRVIAILPDTRLVRWGAVAKLEEAVAGEEVGGLIRKNSDGKLEAVMVRFGPKTEEETRSSGTQEEKEVVQESETENR